MKKTLIIENTHELHMLHHFHRCRIVNQQCFLVLFPTHEILIFHGPYTRMVSMVSTADLVCVKSDVVVGYGPSESQNLCLQMHMHGNDR